MDWGNPVHFFVAENEIETLKKLHLYKIKPNGIRIFCSIG